MSAWKAKLLADAAGLFEDGRRRPTSDPDEPSSEELYEQIGRLKMELVWLKKTLPTSTAAKRACIDPRHSTLSITRQCELVGLPRSSWYYEPMGESAENLALMKRIDKQYLDTPFFGSRRMADELGYNRKRIARLMRLLGIEAIYPNPADDTGRPRPISMLAIADKL